MSMETLKRIIATIAAFAVWYLSAKFSAAGFGFIMNGYPTLGWTMVGLITALELLFTGRVLNRTLFAAGLGAYFYSIYTNFVGLLDAAAGPSGVMRFSEHPFEHLGVMLLLLVVATFFDVLPEPLFIYGVFGPERARESDPLGIIIDALTGNAPWFNSAPRPQRPKYHRATTPKGRVRGA